MLEVSSINVGGGAASQRTQTAWELLLFLRILSSLETDSTKATTNRYDELVKALRRLGLLGVESTALIARLAAKSVTIDAKVLRIDFGSRAPASGLGIVDVNEVIRHALEEVRTRELHIVALDGLDGFFFQGGAGWTSLSGLIDAVSSVNRFLMRTNVIGSVVVTLRSDHFDSLNSQNSNKLKDQTVYLDWQEGGIGSANQLWTMATRKAAVGCPEVGSLAAQYLCNRMDRPAFPSVADYLLSYTRLLPRDVIAILGFVQACHPGSSPVTEDAAKLAAQRYAREYFVGETMNNLAGVLEDDRAHKIVRFRDALRVAPRRHFDLDYLESELDGELERTELIDLLRRMFETGSIGIRTPTGGGGFHYEYVWRNVAGAGFTHRNSFELHDALTRAWNRPWN